MIRGESPERINTFSKFNLFNSFNAEYTPKIGVKSSVYGKNSRSSTKNLISLGNSICCLKESICSSELAIKKISSSNLDSVSI